MIWGWPRPSMLCKGVHSTPRCCGKLEKRNMRKHAKGIIKDTESSQSSKIVQILSLSLFLALGSRDTFSFLQNLTDQNKIKAQIHMPAASCSTGSRWASTKMLQNKQWWLHVLDRATSPRESGNPNSRDWVPPSQEALHSVHLRMWKYRPRSLTWNFNHLFNHIQWSSPIFTHLQSTVSTVYSVSTQRLLSVCSVSTQCLPRAYSVSTVIKRSLCHCLLRDPWYAGMQKSYCNQIQNERAHDSLIFTVASWASGLAP